MAGSKFLNPANDLVFKRIFGSEKNKDILERSCPIEDVTFLKTIQDPEIAPFRSSIVDVMCQDQANSRFVIEMQLSHEQGFDKRSLYYAAKTYCSQLTKELVEPGQSEKSKKRKKRFKDLKDVYFLAITGFTPFPKKKTWLSRIGLTDLDINEHDIKAIQLFFMQLPFFKKTKKDIKTMTLQEKWAYFFKYAEETTDKDLEILVGKDEIIKRAYDELDRFGWSEKELNTYESVEMKKMADEGVRLAAVEEGRKEERLEIARLMFEEKFSIEQISRLTGLGEEERKKLQR